MMTFDICKHTFRRGIERANVNKALYIHVSNTAPAALSCDDILRAAIVTASSAFDLLNHQLYRCAISNSLYANRLTTSVSLPAEALHRPFDQLVKAHDRSLVTSLGYKSFLMPDKISQLFSPIIDDFWSKVSIELSLATTDAKDRIKHLGNWRNRIVHESDINPDLAGVDEWPRRLDDTAAAIADYEKIGYAIHAVLQREHPSP